MHPPAGSGPETDLVQALVARVDEIDAQVRATTAAVDEKSLKEFRRTVETLSKRDAKFEERLTNKVDVLADRLETLARTISTTSAALAANHGEIAQLRRDLDGESARFERALASARQGHDPTALVEVKRTVAELSKQKLPRGLEDRIDELTSKLALLAQRIDTVSSTVSTTAAGLAGRDGDMTSLRRAYEADLDRLSSELAELRRSIDPAPVLELREAVKELRQEAAARQRSSQRLHDQSGSQIEALTSRYDSLATWAASATTRISADEEQLSALRAHVEEAGVHLNSLAGVVATVSERLDARDVELETLQQRFFDASTRVDGLVAELTRALGELPDPATTEQHLEGRLRELDRVRVHDRVRVEALAEELESVVASVAALAEHDPEREALERRVDELAARIDTADDDRAGASSEIARLAAILEVERAAVRSRLESLAAAQESWAETLSVGDLERVAGLAGRVEAIAHEGQALATRVVDLAGTFETERASFQTQLEALASALSWTSPKSSLDARLGDLDRRLEELERQAATVASKVSQATTLLPTALRSLETRLDELTLGQRGPAAPDRAPQAELPQPTEDSEPVASEDDPVHQLSTTAAPRGSDI